MKERKIGRKKEKKKERWIEKKNGEERNIDKNGRKFERKRGDGRKLERKRGEGREREVGGHAHAAGSAVRSCCVGKERQRGASVAARPNGYGGGGEELRRGAAARSSARMIGAE